ncbi:MAG TPA: hypothetical protein PLT66_04950, partial [Bacillota bacterium]|nr:hypothetical protein [Bacillota bacterium]
IMNKVEFNRDVFDEVFKDDLDDVLDSVLQKKFYALINESADKVTINENELANYSIVSAPVMS